MENKDWNRIKNWIDKENKQVKKKAKWYCEFIGLNTMVYNIYPDLDYNVNGYALR